MKTCGLQMHAPFLRCCELWYGTNRIYYDFVLRETWHPEISFSKTLKIQSLSVIMNTYHGHMTWFKFKTLVICYLYSHWVLSNCCDPCRDSSHALLICHESFSPKFFICRKEVWGYSKKKRDTWSSQNSKRKERKWNTWIFQVLKRRDQKECQKY